MKCTGGRGLVGPIGRLEAGELGRGVDGGRRRVRGG